MYFRTLLQFLLHSIEPDLEMLHHLNLFQLTQNKHALCSRSLGVLGRFHGHTVVAWLEILSNLHDH